MQRIVYTGKRKEFLLGFLEQDTTYVCGGDDLTACHHNRLELTLISQHLSDSTELIVRAYGDEAKIKQFEIELNSRIAENNAQSQLECAESSDPTRPVLCPRTAFISERSIPNQNFEG